MWYPQRVLVYFFSTWYANYNIINTAIKNISRFLPQKEIVKPVVPINTSKDYKEYFIQSR